MPQVIRAFLSTEARQERANCSVDLRNGSRFGAAQTFFEFAVSHLNRVEVRRIFRQVPERRARRFDDLANARTQMDPTIVDDDNVTAPQCWTQTLLQIGQKHLCGHCSLKRHCRSHFVVPQCRYEGDCLPASKQKCYPRAPSARRSYSHSSAAST